MSIKKSALMALVGLSLTFGTAAAASASTGWQDTHPRRTEVMHRVHKQDMRITKERHEGEIGPRQAMLLKAHDHAVVRQEQRDARLHGGHITKVEQRHFNHALNKNSRKIGR